jgi:hemoglobin
MKSLLKPGLALVAAALLVTLAALPPQARTQNAAPAAATPAAKSLYDRLGGLYPIAALTDVYIDRLLADPVITANKDIVAGLGAGHVPGLKFQVTALVAQVTGGPVQYTGRGMKEVHARMQIGEQEWAAAAADFQVILDQFQVPAAEQKELLDIILATKPDIVTAP